ncbi:hypothetical protein NNC19_18040 [Clostridium sp. SHJSY1]|uniref:hypothetical protein n=1 Tax=Clostridium sp. SHJSY1 TaxID=2942483 RepID=UPI0028750234|nr:hypothetical protein [Clostridium sp. SHJSY1]MDS0527594.1 hypothetical protein [Clostridium sp. SHJSY1]
MKKCINTELIDTIQKRIKSTALDTIYPKNIFCKLLDLLRAKQEATEYLNNLYNILDNDIELVYTDKELKSIKELIDLYTCCLAKTDKFIYQYLNLEYIPK